MNKTIIININSIVFHIEEDAYDMLRAYMIDIKKHFGHSEDSKEILADIENRIAEMFTDKIQSGLKEVINIQDVEAVITQMGRVSDFEMDEQESGSSYSANTGPSYNYNVGKKLMRDPDDKVFGGVCSGLGHYFGIESRWVRLLFVLLFLFAGTGFLFYIILWIIMPLAVTRVDKMEMRGEAPNIQNFKKNFEEEMGNIRENFSGAGASVNQGMRSAGNAIGYILIVMVKVIGIIFAFSIGVTLLSLLIAFIAFSLGISKVGPEGIVETFNFIDAHDAPFAYLAGFLTLNIPLVAVFYIIIRILFNRKPMNNYLSISLLVAFILSFLGSVYYITNVVKDFKERSIIVQEKALPSSNTYYFSLNDTREIKISDTTDRKNMARLTLNNKNLLGIRKDDIRIRFEQIDSLAKPYIKYEFSSKGRTYQLATQRASNIEYNTQIDSNHIRFDSHFNLLNDELFRDQEVNITVYLPVGSHIILDRSIRWKVRDVPFEQCYPDNSHDIKQTEWKITDRGIRCEVEPNPHPEENDLDFDIDLGDMELKDTIININTKGVSGAIKIKK